MELTILMPCLNEAETLEKCITKAHYFLSKNNIIGEILISDNGSTDGSQAIAERLGARVIHIKDKGYGAALIGGINEANGEYVIMGDSDDSYDFSKLELFVLKLREGFDLVMGNRFLGGINPGAMPPLHKYLGNPFLSLVGKVFFRSPCNDFHCGLRGFNKSKISNLNLKHPGMEFASEMVLKSTIQNLKITEVPTTLSCDGRSRQPHLRSWRDGWRHLRLLLICAPSWLFLVPGLLLFSLGIILTISILPRPLFIWGYGLDIHTLLYANALVVIGIQSIYFFLHAKVYAIFNEYIPYDSLIMKINKLLSLERSLVCGLLLMITSISLTICSLATWRDKEFLFLEPNETMRLVIPAVTCNISSECKRQWIFLNTT